MEQVSRDNNFDLTTLFTINSEVFGCKRYLNNIGITLLIHN